MREEKSPRGGDGGETFNGGGPSVTARGVDVCCAYLSRGERVMYLRRILRNVQGAG